MNESITNNRELVCEAKRLADRNWIEGYYHKQIFGKLENECEITSFIRQINNLVSTIIDPTTLRQYTNFNTKGGDRVFEGNIVEYKCGSSEARIGVVVYIKTLGIFAIQRMPNHEFTNYGTNKYSAFVNKTTRVLGRIDDNPQYFEKDGDNNE